MIVVIAATGTNLGSIANALKRLDMKFCITNELKPIQQASHVILPGVGSSLMGMSQLQQHELVNTIQNLRCPVLGICLGMQLLFDFLEEDTVTGLGIIPGKVAPLPGSVNYPSPHMGWNRIAWHQNTELGRDVPAGSYVYFVHSFAVNLNAYTLARCDYSVPFSAIVQKDNFFGMQFHPEKSAATGLKLLRNFCLL